MTHSGRVISQEVANATTRPVQYWTPFLTSRPSLSPIPSQIRSMLLNTIEVIGITHGTNVLIQSCVKSSAVILLEPGRVLTHDRALNPVLHARPFPPAYQILHSDPSNDACACYAEAAELNQVRIPIGVQHGTATCRKATMHRNTPTPTNMRIASRPSW